MTGDGVACQPENDGFETVCDSYKGAAHGLCVAYCEARHCDKTSRPGCDNIRARFQKITGIMQMPCERCPCWDAAELQAITSDNVSQHHSCWFGSDADQEFLSDDTISFSAVVKEISEYNVCTTSHGGNRRSIMDITDEEVAYCLRDIRQRCVELGFPMYTEQEDCPCWDASVLQTFTKDDVNENDSCSSDANYEQIAGKSDAFFFSAYDGGDFNHCRIDDNDVRITDAQVANCLGDLRQKCEEMEL